MQIAHFNSTNHMSRENWVPDMITCHICEGTFAGSVSWLCDYASDVSAHFVVGKKGEIAQLVDLKRAAWANGTKTSKTAPGWYGNSPLKTVRDRKTNANLYTISIEFEGFYEKTKGDLTPQQLEAGVWLIKYIRNQVLALYGKDIPFDRQHIVGHNEISPITKPYCPGDNFPWDKLIKELNSNGEAEKPVVTVKNDKGDEEDVAVVYETFDDIPSWGQGTIEMLIEKGLLHGTGTNAKGEAILNLSHDLVRTLVIISRTGLFDAKLKRYTDVDDLPEWAKASVNAMVEQGVIADGNNINMTEDMVRTLIMASRF